MSDTNNNLESYIARRLTDCGITARRTRGSGASTEIGDIYNDRFFVECKMKLTKTNIIMDYEKEYIDLLNKIPINTQKECIFAYENIKG